MEDLALERLKQILSWMRPHEWEVVLATYVGRYPSAVEYVRQELARILADAPSWILEHIAYERLTEEWVALGGISILDDPGDDDVAPGVFVLRGSR